MKIPSLLVMAVLCLSQTACDRKSRKPIDAALQAQINDVCRAALEKIERDRPAMQKYLSPLNQGVGYVLAHRHELSLDEDQIEDLLEFRVAVEKDINALEARVKTLSTEIRSEMQIEGLDNANIEDRIQKIAEIQAQIEQRKFKALAKSVNDLNEDQGERLREILLKDLE